MICHGLGADEAIFNGPARPLLRLILPAFFALSGFLIAGSLERSKTLGMFLGLRALRIYPGLIAYALITAFVIGPMVTRFSIHDYFTDPIFFQYQRTLLGDVQFYLPGVFSNNPQPDIVGGQLWTIPFELYSYATLAGFALIGLRRHRMLAPLSVVVVTASYLFITLVRHHWTIVYVPGAINGALLIATSLAGAAIYAYRDIVPWNFSLFAVAVILSVACVGYLPYGDFFAPFPAAYTTIYIGLFNPNRRPLHGADYSYGVYLYGFTIQQVVVYAFPFARGEIANMLVSVPAVVLIAAFSWHFVEHPVHRLRFVMKRLETSYLSLRTHVPRATSPAVVLQRDDA